MDDQAVQLILSRLDSMETNSNHNFDLLVGGIKTMHEKFEAHEKEDSQQFEAIRTDIATSTASASTAAKFWAGIGSVASLFLGALLGIGGDYFLFGRNGK